MGDGSPTAKLEFRIEDVSRKHQNRSFALALVAYQDTDEAMRSTEAFTNPIKVLSKKPKSKLDLAKKLSDDKRKLELIDRLKSRELGRDTKISRVELSGGFVDESQSRLAVRRDRWACRRARARARHRQSGADGCAGREAAREQRVA